MNTCSLGLRALREDQLASAFKYGKDYFLRTSRPCPDWEGEGIIVVGGGKYLQWALNNVKNCRRFDSETAIEVWCLNRKEIPDTSVFEALNTKVVNAEDVLPRNPMRKFGGWHLKMYAVLHSRFRRVLLLDADCFATRTGLRLLQSGALAEKGAIFCSDVKTCHRSNIPYVAAGIKPPSYLFPPQQEWETGAFVLDKAKCHPAIRMAVWTSEHSDAWWKLGHGDKLDAELAFRGLSIPHILCESRWLDWGIAHTLNGEWLFAHMLGVKRGKANPPDLTESLISG